MIKELKIPALSEGNTDSEGVIIAIPYAAGSQVQTGDTLLEVETDKVTVEIPSELEGTLEEVILNVDDKVSQGTVFARIQTEEKKSEKATANTIKEEHQTVATNEGQTTNEQSISTNKSPALKQQKGDDSYTIIANPSARRLAREIGIDISHVKGSEKHGRITKQDVKNTARKKIQNSSDTKTTTQNNGNVRPLPDFSEFGPIHREKLTNINLATSDNMVNAWSRIPHAWLQQEIDITELEVWRQQCKQDIKNKGGSLTVTVIIAKALAHALKAFPKINSSYDDLTNEIIYKNYTDIGIAVDTEQGLLVPTLRSVDKKSITELSIELSSLSQKARERKLSLKEMQGGGVTLSNLGGMGISTIFPIVNWPQVAIIGVAASIIKTRLHEGELAPRRILTITLGFDHRIINGADGAKFLIHLKKLLEDTRLMLL